MPSDQRIQQELQNKKYLIGKTVRWKRIKPYDEGDGQPCVFCWKELSSKLSHLERDEGFQEEESGDWICFRCLETFFIPFDWQIIWPIGIPGQAPIF